MLTDSLPEPRVIPRSEHPISRQHIDREALKVMYRLRDAGFLAYLVGGGVRDLYLGKQPKDFDISTNARPGELRKLFRNSRIIGRRFRLVQVFYPGGKIIEVSTFRCRSEHDLNGGDEVLASNNTFGSPAEDAFRRDLTINALFYEIEHFSIIDYVGGVEDLKQRVVRMVGDPDRRIVRDPVRMMRAVRHAARSEFTIEPATWEAICRHREKLALCPLSRLRDELFKDLRGGASAAWARLALDCGIFYELLPWYRPIFPAGSGAVAAAGFGGPQDLLLKLLVVCDRMVRAGQQVPEELLLAMVMLPWSMEQTGLFAQPLKGKEAFAFARGLRIDLDEALQRLNVKRTVKEAIVTLHVTLPLFLHHRNGQGWPKWLTRKSYFPMGELFFQLFQAAVAGGELPRLPAPAEKKPAAGRSARSRKRPPRRGSRMPAFSPKKGGVFGLKK